METKKTERDGPLKNIKIKIIIICGDWNNLLANYWSTSNVWNLHSNKKKSKNIKNVLLRGWEEWGFHFFYCTFSLFKLCMFDYNIKFKNV